MVDAPGTKSVSHSELKTYERCPKQWHYKYEELLVPRQKSRPLFLGNWVHAALEAHYRNGDWKIGHAPYLKIWNSLFEEERIALRKPRTRNGKTFPTIAPLPEMVESIMRSYVWYYRDDGWTPHYVEHEFRVDTGVKIDGVQVLLKGIIDLIVEDSEGLWIIDHKTAGNIPEPTAFHAMDPQLMLYPWAAKRALGIEVAGVVYNYVRSKAPSVPKLNRDGSISKRKLVTDYPTLRRFLRANGRDPADYSQVLHPLRRRSPLLRRYRLPREPYVTREVLRDAISVTRQIQTAKRRVRVVTRDCATMCAYHDVCRAELNGLDTSHMRKLMFTIKGEEADAGISLSDDQSEDDGEESD